MKKISLKNLNLKEVEQLSREQLKNVLGGYVGGSGGGTNPVTEDKCRDLCSPSQPCNAREICEKVDCKIDGYNVGRYACYHLTNGT